jgi:hypothetical protein
VQQPGEPVFLDADTEGALALAEEEADTCPLCHMPKVWCRDINNQFAFQAVEEQCHATYAVAMHHASVNEARDEPTRRAIQTFAGFRGSFRPDFLAGLDLPESSGQVEHDSRNGESG